MSQWRRCSSRAPAADEAEEEPGPRSPPRKHSMADLLRGMSSKWIREATAAPADGGSLSLAQRSHSGALGSPGYGLGRAGLGWWARMRLRLARRERWPAPCCCWPNSAGQLMCQPRAALPLTCSG